MTAHPSHKLPTHESPRPPYSRICPLTLKTPTNASFAPSLAVRKVYQRIGLEDISTLKSYQEWGKHYGLEFVGFDDHANNLVVHYESVRSKPLYFRSKHVCTWHFMLAEHYLQIGCEYSTPKFPASLQHDLMGCFVSMGYFYNSTDFWSNCHLAIVRGGVCGGTRRPAAAPRMLANVQNVLNYGAKNTHKCGNCNAPRWCTRGNC